VNSWRDEPEGELVGEGQPDMNDEAGDGVGDVLWKSIASTRVEKWFGKVVWKSVCSRYKCIDAAKKKAAVGRAFLWWAAFIPATMR
jgi:hypothetical protein